MTHLTWLDAVNTANATIKDLDIAPGGLLKNEGQGDGGLFKGILVRYPYTFGTKRQCKPNREGRLCSVFKI